MPTVTGPCGQAGSSGSGLAYIDCSPLSKPVSTGDSIVVLATTSNGGGTHTAPTDSAGNTYVLVGSVAGLNSGANSIWLASNITGATQLAVRANATSAPSFWGVVVWPLYGVCTSNADFVSGSGNGTTGTTSTTGLAPVAGSLAIGGVSTNLNPLVTADSPWITRFHSRENIAGTSQNLYTCSRDVSAVFAASWAFDALVNWVAVAASFSGPTAPPLGQTYGLTQSIYDRTNITTATDDGSDYDAFSALKGNGWQSSADPQADEVNTSVIWPTRSRLSNLRVIVDVADASGGDVTRTYAVRKNGVDTDLSVTVSGTSSAADTRFSGSDLVDYVDLESGDAVSLHRTGDGAGAEFDVTWWSMDAVHQGGTRSVTMFQPGRLNNSVAVYAAAFDWRASPEGVVPNPSGDFTAFDVRGRSLVVFDGTISQYRVSMRENTQLAADTYTFNLVKNGVVQDGTGGTANTTVVVDGADLETVSGSFSLAFVSTDVLALQSTPSAATPAPYAGASMVIDATTAGIYGLSITWTSFTGGSGGTVPKFAGINFDSNTNTEARDVALLLGPLTYGVLGVLQAGGSGPGSGNHLFYTLRKNGGDTALSLDLTGANTGGVVTASIPFAVGTDTMDWSFTRTGSPGDQLFVLAMSALGEVTTSPVASSVRRVIRRLRRFPLPNDELAWLFISQVQLYMQAGTGLSTGQGSDPVVMFRFSKDGGATWSHLQDLHTGKIGEYHRRAIARRLGRGRDWVLEFSTTDPVFNAWIDCFADISRGTS